MIDCSHHVTLAAALFLLGTQLKEKEYTLRAGKELQMVVNGNCD